MNATQKNYVEKVDLIIHHPLNDKNRSSYQEAIYISIKNKSFGIFKKFLSLLDDINKYEYEDISILPLATKYTNLESFNPKKTDFLNVFKDIFCITNDSYEILNMLINFDKEHNHYIDFIQLLQEGNSIFNLAKY